MSENTSGGSGSGGQGGASDAGWYDLFSRGARDWLRHNDKVRDAVRQHLPQIVAGADVLSGGASTVRVPVRMLEHYRFKLRNSNEQQGVGQGQAKPGDRIGRPQEGDNQRGQGGNEDGDDPVHARVSHRRHRRLAVGRDAAAEPRGEGRPREGR